MIILFVKSFYKRFELNQKTTLNLRTNDLIQKHLNILDKLFLHKVIYQKIVESCTIQIKQLHFFTLK